MKTAAIILAAGLGKRMRSSLPKVMHRCAGVPLLDHVVRLARARKCDPIIVVLGPGGDAIADYLQQAHGDAPLRFATQAKPRGTADAVLAGLLAMPKRGIGQVLILAGDVPLLRAETLAKMQRQARRKKLVVLSAKLAQPFGYGRLVRRDEDERSPVMAIVEERDATPEQRKIDEINAGVYLCTPALLRKALAGVSSANAQGEYYLTDIVATAAQDDEVAVVCAADSTEVMGVNTRLQLSQVEVEMRARLCHRHMEKGVGFADWRTAIVDADVKLAADVFIGPGAQLYGHTVVATGARIEGPSVSIDAVIGKRACVRSFSHIEQATIGADVVVGPFARLRPGAQLDAGSAVGNFVEVKNSRLRRGAKAGHLSYLGDADVGSNTNIGAGTITCNYDGKFKHQTVIGAGSFVGSNSTLVAPLHIGKGAFVAAGSTVTDKVESDALVFGRARQSVCSGGAKAIRERLSARAKLKD